MATRRPLTRQWNWSNIALGTFALLVCAYLLVPILIVIPISFSSGTFLSYPLPGISLRWYENVLTPFPWLTAMKNSLIIASATVVVATTLGTLAAYGLSIANFPGRGLIIALIISPLIVPLIIIALGVYFLFARTGLSGTFTGLILAHSVLALPYVVITVLASLKGFDRRLVRASASLGANEFRTFFHITLPLIMPGVLSGAVFAFITSFDEVIVAIFIASPAQFTLPRQLFSGLRDQMDPSIVAVATLLTVLTISLLAVVEILRRRADRLGYGSGK